MTTDAAAMESITRGSAQAAGRRHRDGVRGNLLFGAAIALALVGGLGGWVATTSLAGAVIAGGTVVVESSVKAVQHQLGGIVGEILVRNGDRVTAGEVVIRLDETTLRANLDIVSNHLDRARIRMARLEAELAGAADMSLPQSMRDRADDPQRRACVVSQPLPIAGEPDHGPEIAQRTVSPADRRPGCAETRRRGRTSGPEARPRHGSGPL